MPEPKVVIIGGGISGLSAAWALLQAGVREFLLLEASGRAGGVMASERDASGFLLEHGPDSMLRHKPAAIELCQALGLADELVATLPGGGARVLCNGRLEPLPAGWRMVAPTLLQPVLASPLFSAAEKAALAEHWGPPAEAPPDDESVAGYLRRRFGAVAGAAIAQRVAEPMLAGVYGGSADTLSRTAVIPAAAMLSAEAENGAAPAGGPVAAASLFVSLRGGMGKLAQALAQRLPAASLQLNAAAVRLTSRAGGGYRIEAGERRVWESAAVIVALPAPAAAQLLRELDAELAAALAAIPYGSSLSVNLGYRRAPELPPGFGFVAPRCEGRRLLACTFAHQKYPGRAPAGGGLLRLFYAGGEMDWPNSRVEALAREELRSVLNVSDAPDLVRIRRWRAAMPQYTVGHGQRLHAIAAAAARHAGLQLAGNAYHGVGVPDCVASGMAAAAALM